MKKFLIICLSALFLFACAAFTACDTPRADEAGGTTNNGGSEAGDNNGDSGERDDESDNKGDNDNKGDSGDEFPGGNAYNPPVYDGALPSNYFGTYYLSEYLKVEDGLIVKTAAADETDPESEFSTAKYNVTVLSDNSVFLNFGGRADRKGVFSVEDKILKVEQYSLTSLNTVKMLYDENLKFEFLNGELVLIKLTVSGGKEIRHVYNFKKGESLFESDYPVDINSFGGVYEQKHSGNQKYLVLKLANGSLKVETHSTVSGVEEFDGVAVLLAEGDGYKLVFRYNNSADKFLTFDYALNLTSQDYERV